MIRYALYFAMCISLAAQMVSAQVTYTSQTRTISALGSGIGAEFQQSAATNFDAWTAEVISRASRYDATASQSSSLEPWLVNLSSEAIATEGSAASICNFTFTPTVAMSLRIVGSGRGNGSTFSLQGPGVNLAYNAGPFLKLIDFTVSLQAGQSYAFASGATQTSSSASLQMQLSFSPAPVPQGRGFSYQGVVRDATGQPISTPTDMEFRLFFQPELGGTQVGPTITVNAVEVVNGLFTQNLDFGDVFDGNARWLEVSVRNPAGGGAFTPVLPRTRISSTPYASHALHAASATNAMSALEANSAASTPWSGLTGQAGVLTPAINAGWQMLFVNTSNTNFRGGMRQADSGFFEVTNNANGASPKFARLDSNGNWSAVSDARLKTDVKSAKGNLDAAMKLRPVTFRWKFDGKEDQGLIAQEVRAVLPLLVAGDESKHTLSVNYSQLGVVAIGAIQEQQAQIKALRDELGSLRAEAAKRELESAELRARLERMERRLAPAD